MRNESKPVVDLRILFSKVLADLAEKQRKTWAYMEPEEGEALKRTLKAKLGQYNDEFEAVLSQLEGKEPLRYAPAHKLVSSQAWVVSQYMLEAAGEQNQFNDLLEIVPGKDRSQVEIAARRMAADNHISYVTALDIVIDQYKGG
jgi:hypothetical protein